jgi:hypothetical protein
MYTDNTSNIATCPYCGNIHTGLCSKIKEIEYYKDGTIKRVVLITPSDYMAPMQLPPVSFDDIEIT